MLTSRQIAARELRRLRAEYPGLHNRPAVTSKVWAAARLSMKSSHALERGRSKCITIYARLLADAAHLLNPA